MYNGHKNWNHWSVNLHLNNDEMLYNAMLRFTNYLNRREAADVMLEHLEDLGMSHTPDGAPYTKTTILAAMRGL